MKALSALLLRDVRLALRLGGGALLPLLFFLTLVAILPFAIGPDMALLRRIGPAMLWLGALLAGLLAIDQLISADAEDGSLDLILMGRVPLELALGAKAVAHWITTGLPVVVATPLVGLLLDLAPSASAWVALSLLVGTPALTCLGLVGAALGATLRRGGLLLPIVTIPLAVPVLIFGVAASNAAVAGSGPFPIPFTILCGLALASFVIGPIAAAAALRQGLD